ncbi:MAG: thiamine phosphate synthase [Elusimicrobia bacterium]|nr:thiamine phosphate synthase [Elusimicrobiota bacterium]
MAKLNLDGQLYCLTSEEHSNGRTVIETAEAMLAGGARILQYREKNKHKRAKHEECLLLRRLMKKRGCLFIVNDDLDIALAVKADGVHLGQDDMPLEAARELTGPKMIIGISTHNPAQARAAVQGGADYIGVGPIYATKTKKDVCPAVGLEYLDYAVRNVNIPFVAIGGIKLRNLSEVLARGARCVAMVTEITGAPDIAAAVRAASGRLRFSRRSGRRG